MRFHRERLGCQRATTLDNLLDRFRRRATAEQGATATEYSILAGFIAIAIVTGVGLLGLALDGYFNGLTNGVKAALGMP